MDTKNTSRQFRYLEEVRIPLHRAGFETLPVEGEQLPVLWNGAPLCRITGKGSVFYRREDADTPQAEDALFRVEDIAAKTLEYMTAMEAAPQLKASGLDGDYRILTDFGGMVLAGTPSKHGVQFVTWDWDYLNRQPYGFLVQDHSIYLVQQEDAYTDNLDAALDLGIVMLHFSAVASQWAGQVRWELSPAAPDGLPEGLRSAAVYHM